MTIRLAILGSTGSIGRQTLDIVSRHPDRFEVVALIAGRDADALAAQADVHRPKLAGLAGLDAHDAFPAGASLLTDAATHPDADVVVNAVVGSRGLAATLAAADAGKAIALANKESLVAGGSLVAAALGSERARLRPIDSEHAGLAQLVAAVRREEIGRLVITASGGPFRTRENLRDVTVAEALAHPTWRMGDRITIDSATLMNKGLELIEAHHLFGVPAGQLGAIAHPQSLVHAIVELIDGSQLLQAAVPDMRAPIAWAIDPSARLDVGLQPLDLAATGSLVFEPIDHARFPAVRLALHALELGGSAGATLNAADEEAVAAFLEHRIGFVDIIRIVTEVLERLGAHPVTSFEDVRAAEREARAAARALIDNA